MQTTTTGPKTASAHLLLAHGAGAPMTSEFLETVAGLLADRGVRVTRFNFPYMAAFQADGKRRPPPKLDVLCDAYIEFIGRSAVRAQKGCALFIGGKSMGGRIATMISDKVSRQYHVAGVVCLGYPFHPKGKPEKVRTAHLEHVATPTLIVQGERDALGSIEDVNGYVLSNVIKVVWAKDGDHDLKPRKLSGATLTDNLTLAADEMARWMFAHQPVQQS